MPSISTRILPSRKTFAFTRKFFCFKFSRRWLGDCRYPDSLPLSVGECAAPKSNLILHALECKKSASLSIDTARKAIGKWNRNPFLLACLIRIRKNIYGCEMFAQFLCSQSFYLRSICIYEHMIGQNYWLYDKLSAFVAIYYVSLWEGLVRVIRGDVMNVFPAR
jgi:hypothetical protein